MELVISSFGDARSHVTQGVPAFTVALLECGNRMQELMLSK